MDQKTVLEKTYKKFLEKYKGLINTVLIYEDVDMIKPFVDYVNYIAYELIKIHYKGNYAIKLTPDVVIAREINKMFYILNTIRKETSYATDMITSMKIRDIVIEAIIIHFSDTYKNKYTPSSIYNDFSYHDFISIFYDAVELMSGIYSFVVSIPKNHSEQEEILNRHKNFIRTMNRMTTTVNIWLTRI